MTASLFKKLREAHTLPAEALLNKAGSIAFYAYRSHAAEEYSCVWDEFGLAYPPSILNSRALLSLITLALLCEKADALSLADCESVLGSDHPRLELLKLAQEPNTEARSLNILRDYLEGKYNDDGIVVMPWEDDPLIGYYEKLHAVLGTDWTSLDFVKTLSKKNKDCPG